MLKVDEYSVTIRAVQLRDVTAALTWLMDEKVSRFCPWKRIKAIRYFVRNEFRHPWAGDDMCRAEIGYWGKGLATMAVRKVARAVFAECSRRQGL